MIMLFMKRSNVLSLFILLVVITMLTAGCSALSGGNSQKSLSSSPDVTTVGSDRETGVGPGNYYPVSTQHSVISGDPIGIAKDRVITQEIISTAQVTLEVTDVPASVDRLKVLAAGKGGYFASSSFNTQYNDRQTATVVLRVPEMEFERTLTGVKEIGKATSANTKNEDITADYVDLQARKISYQNQIAQFNEIMKKSEKIEDILNVQEQIDRVQTSLDQIEGRIRYLDNQVDLSTITVSLAEKEPVGADAGHSFTKTMNEGIAGLLAMIDLLIIALFVLLPLIVIGFVGYSVYRLYQSKKTVKSTTTLQQEIPEKK